MHTKDIERNGKAASLEIYDTAGQEAYSDLRNSLFGKGHVRAANLRTAILLTVL